MHNDNESGFSATRRRLLRLGTGGIAIVIAACQEIRRPGPGPKPGWIARLYADTGAGVWRDGHVISYAPGMHLQTGDELETDGTNFALIEFFNGDGVYMKPLTRVRVGSIFVFFGEIFNRIVSGRGFRADSEAMEAGVEETEFLMHIDRGSQEATVIVRRGAVRCVPRRATWAPQLVRENQRLTAQRISALQPRMFQMNSEEVTAAMHWADEAARRLKHQRVTPDRQPPYRQPPERQPAYPPSSPPVIR